MRVYEVVVEVQTDELIDGEMEWWDTRKNVFVPNDDAMEAVRLATAAAVEEFQEPYEDDDKQTITPKVVGVRLARVAPLLDVDISA